MTDGPRSDRDLLVDGLCELGFKEVHGGYLVGELDGHRLNITINEDFPFYPPSVCLEDPAPPTWHQETDGSLCLYAEGGSGLPWRTTDGLVSRIREWFDNADRGWPDDPGEPDLERYFDVAPHGTLVTYDDIDDLVGKSLTFDKRKDGWFHAVPGPWPNRKQRRSKGRPAIWGYAADLGTLERPVLDWDDIVGRLQDQDLLPAITDLAHRDSWTGLLLLRYAREGSEGRREAVVALWVDGDKTRLTVKGLRVADVSDHAVHRPRQGATARLLRRKTIAIVGCGAVGSFLAEELARAGIGRLLLVDRDYLRPGNCVRHLCTAEQVPLPKVDAVQQVLDTRGHMDADSITVWRERLTPTIAADLFREAHLVVDASAHASCHEILFHVSTELGEQAPPHVRVGVHRDGDLVRIDRFGGGALPADHPTRPAPVEAREDGPTKGQPYREVGCGDPVSPTPPYAARSAAVTACRWAVDSLRPTRLWKLPDSTVDVLVAQPDTPFNEVGIVR